MRTRHLIPSAARGEGERGATLIIFAVFLVVAVVMLAAVIDLGGQRQERKELTLSTDAAALAGASVANTEDSDLLTAGNGVLVDCVQVGISSTSPNPDSFANVQAAVDDYLLRNGESSRVDCKVARTSFKEGYVLVSADEIVDYAFAPAIGLDSGSVSGVSVAAIEVNNGGGLRPVGICGATETLAGVSGYPEFTLGGLTTGGGSGGYKLDGDGYVIPSTGTPTRTEITGRFAIEKVKGGACTGFTGGGSGNFGKLDFGGGTSTSCTEIGFFCKDYADGYYGTLTNPTKGDTGNNWSNTSTQNSTVNLETNVGQFWAPVYSTATGPGGNADFTLTFFAQMEMVNHCFTGGCKFDGTTWFDLRVSRLVPYTPAGPPLTDDSNLQRPAICSVTGDAASIAAGCPQLVGATTSTLPPASSTSTTTTTTSTTTTTIPACVSPTGIIQLTPVTPARSGNSSNLANNLVIDVDLDVTPCTGLVVTVAKQATPTSVATGTCCTSTAIGYSATVSKQSSSITGGWTPGTYVVTAKVGTTTIATTTFTLS